MTNTEETIATQQPKPSSEKASTRIYRCPFCGMNHEAKNCPVAEHSEKQTNTLRTVSYILGALEYIKAIEAASTSTRYNLELKYNGVKVIIEKLGIFRMTMETTIEWHKLSYSNVNPIIEFIDHIDKYFSQR